MFERAARAAAILSLFWALRLGVAQPTPQYCPTTGCIYSGNVATPTLKLGPKTIGAGPNQLPAAAAGNNGWITTVTDAANPGDCTVGGGTSVTLCRSNGSAWSPFSGAGLQSVQGQTGPAVTLSGDGYVNPGTASGNNIPLTHTQLDQLNTPNAHTTGNQIYETGSGTNPALVIQSFANNAANIVNSGNTHSSQVITPTVAVGQLLVLWIQGTGGCCSAPQTTSNLGNTFTQLNGADSCSSALCQAIWYSKITVAGTDSENTHGSDGLWILLSGINLTSPFDPTTASNPQWVAAPGSLTFPIVQGGANDLIVNFTNIDSGTLTPANCNINLTSGFSSFQDYVGDGSRTIRGQNLTSNTLGSANYVVSSSCNSGSGFLQGFTIALQISGTVTQSVCMAPIRDGNSNQLACAADPTGAFNPPQSAGNPATTPAPGTHSYNSTSKNDIVYDQTNGWVPSAEGPTSAPATSDLACYADTTGGKLKDCGAQIGGGKVVSFGHLGATSCTTGTSTYSTCDNTVTISPTMVDTNYTCTWGGTSPSDGRAAIQGATPASATTVTVRIVTEGSVGINFADLAVHCVHN